MKPLGAGYSSFGLIDSRKLFECLELKQGSILLDLGCGNGRYSLAAAEIVGPEGAVFAVDSWEEGLEGLKREASARGLQNLKTLLSDLRARLPLGDQAVEVCLTATVLHDLVRSGAAENALREAARVLRPGGMLAVMEFKKADGPPGPPIDVRMSSQEVVETVSPHGLSQEDSLEVGPHNYLITFRKPRQVQSSP